ncbi:MAG: NAD(+) synthase, partial [Selenomonadaceae bacterium]|nr:NAD(+) synthase [Selenomonadaceae bacterium]
MLNSSKIAIAQMKILSGRPDFNLETMLKFINEAKNQNADIIIFPALSITGRTKATMTNTLLKDYASYKKDIINASSGIKV